MQLQTIFYFCLIITIQSIFLLASSHGSIDGIIQIQRMNILTDDDYFSEFYTNFRMQRTHSWNNPALMTTYKMEMQYVEDSLHHCNLILCIHPTRYKSFYQLIPKVGINWILLRMYKLFDL